MAADVVYGDYEAGPSLVETLYALSGPLTDVLIAQKVRNSEKEAVFRQQMEAWFDIEEVPPEELCHGLGPIYIYKLTKK